MTSASDIAAFLHTDFARLVAAHDVPGGAIAVSMDGEIVEAVAGVLSTATQVEVTTDSVFQIGSVAKVWTATLIMQLVDDRLLDLDEPIRTYLPGFRLADESAAESVTARHLLRHQGGFEGDIFTDTGRGDDAIETYVDGLADVPQVFAPGETTSYNNAGYVVLGRVIEVLREMSWEDAVRDHLAVPLGLSHVAPTAYEAVMFRTAIGHIGSDERGIETPASIWTVARSCGPAGSMLAMRPRDLVGFATMHLTGGVGPDGRPVLSKGSVSAMQGADAEASTSLGWTKYSDELIGHDGGTIGQLCFLRIVPKARLIVVMSTNGGDAAALFDDVVRRVIEEAGEVSLPVPPRPSPLSVEIDAHRLLGTYANSTMELVFSVHDDGRICCTETPIGEVAEVSGEKESRVELVGYAADALITRDPVQGGRHTVYSFAGDDGRGRRKFVNFGRAVPRVD